MYNHTNTARGPQGCGGKFGKFGPREFNELRNMAFQHFGERPFGKGFRRPKYNVPLNIVDNIDAYEVHVYAVGFAKENIKISVVNDVLHISGTREVDEQNLPQFSSQEFPIKSFERQVAINETVDKNAIAARQQDGVLIITLPKTAEAKTPAQEIKVD